MGCFRVVGEPHPAHQCKPLNGANDHLNFRKTAIRLAFIAGRSRDSTKPAERVRGTCQQNLDLPKELHGRGKELLGLRRGRHTLAVPHEKPRINLVSQLGDRRRDRGRQ